jgi:hypothetical protein
MELSQHVVPYLHQDDSHPKVDTLIFMPLFVV